jgi:hypothetical protein
MAIAVVIIVLALFNIIAFIVPFIRGVTFWAGYGFGIIAIAFAAFAVLHAFNRPGLKSKFYGFPIAYIAWVYLALQMIFSICSMALPLIPFWVTIVLSAVLIAFAVIGLITTNMAIPAIEAIDAKVATKTSYIKALQVDIELYADKVSDPVLKERLRALAESIRYSDPMSNSSLETLETQMQARVTQLGHELDNVETAIADVNKLEQSLMERNKKCRLLK